MTEPLELLLACHERIRRFSGGLTALAELPDLTDERIPATAEACHRYFSQALPLHAADEDLSVAPRLRPLELPMEDQQAMIRMEAEHAEIEAALPGVVAALQALIEGDDPPELRERFPPFVALLAHHIEQEERHVFPHLARLLPQEREAITREIRSRRGASS